MQLNDSPQSKKYSDDDTPEIKTLPGGRAYLVIYEPGSRHINKIEMSIEDAIKLIPQVERLLEQVPFITTVKEEKL